VSKTPAEAESDAKSDEQLFWQTYYTRTGRDHLVDGRYINSGNQDCFGRRSTPSGSVAVLADGSSSSFQSKSGSSAAVRIVLNAAEKLLNGGRYQIKTPEDFAKELQKEFFKKVLEHLKPLTRNDRCSKEITSLIEDGFFFTLLIVVVTPDWTAVMGCGDGYYSINGQMKEVKSRAGNFPDYVTYLLCDPIPRGFENIGIKVWDKLDTLEVESFMLASDGISPVIRARTRNKNFSIKQVWSDERFFKGEDGPANVAAIFNDLATDEIYSSVKQVGELVQVEPKTRRGIFNDDVTFIVFVRNPAKAIPENWLDYRKRYEPLLAKKVDETEPAVAAEDSAAVKPAAEQQPVTEPVKDSPAKDATPELKLPPAPTPSKTPAKAEEVEKESWIEWLWNLLSSMLGFEQKSEPEPEKTPQQSPRSSSRKRKKRRKPNAPKKK